LQDTNDPSVPIHVREAVREDIPVIADYNQALARETESLKLDPKVLRSGVERAFDHQHLCWYFIAEVDGKAVGQTLITYEWSDWRDGVIWWMQSVYVHPDYRKRGVFQSIYKHIESLAQKDSQARAIRLYVKEGNHHGMNAYRRAGMADSGYVVYEAEL